MGTEKREEKRRKNLIIRPENKNQAYFTEGMNENMFLSGSPKKTALIRSQAKPQRWGKNPINGKYH
ncbi:MAG: hypothetical protein P4M13_09760 [Alphaproteobacteria bacterium]|nr:hypothetical protein [Alphaproteobacteria bacterium]